MGDIGNGRTKKTEKKKKSGPGENKGGVQPKGKGFCGGKKSTEPNRRMKDAVTGGQKSCKSKKIEGPLLNKKKSKRKIRKKHSNGTGEKATLSNEKGKGKRPGKPTDRLGKKSAENLWGKNWVVSFRALPRRDFGRGVKRLAQKSPGGGVKGEMSW